MFLPVELQVILLSALPFTELRASLPLALTVYDLPGLVAYSCAVFGNLLPIPVVFFLFTPLVRYIERFPRVHVFTERYIHALARKHETRFVRFGSLALLTFVMIPLPGTGVWTGSVLAVMFGLPPRYAIPALTIGAMLAGAIVWGIVSGGSAGVQWLVN